MYGWPEECPGHFSGPKKRGGERMSRRSPAEKGSGWLAVRARRTNQTCKLAILIDKYFIQTVDLPSASCFRISELEWA